MLPWRTQENQGRKATSNKNCYQERRRESSWCSLVPSFLLSLSDPQRGHGAVCRHEAWGPGLPTEAGELRPGPRGGCLEQHAGKGQSSGTDSQLPCAAWEREVTGQ